MINVKYQFIRRLLGISLSICTAYGAMRSAFVMASTLGTAPGAVMIAEAKTEQAADAAEVSAEGTAASGEEVNEFVNEEISEDIEVNEDIDQKDDDDVLKEEEMVSPDALSGESEEVFDEPEQMEEAQLQPEPEPEEPDVTLDYFLAGLRCGACGRCCSLLNPHCRRGMHKAQSAEQEYYETYALS